MTNLFPVLIAIVVLTVVAWNVVPPFRERLRGWTTVLEAGLAAALPLIGNAVDAFHDTDWKEFVPETAWPYVIATLSAWFIYKRLVTDTPIGHSR